MPEIIWGVTTTILIIVIAVLIADDIKKQKIVQTKSQRVNDLLNLNKTIEFKKIPSRYFTHHFYCNSKRRLENISLNDCLLSFIDENETLRSVIKSISFNQKVYNNYLIKREAIKSSVTEEYCNSFGFTLTRFLEYEERVFKKKTLDEPSSRVVVHCIASYTSPRGRNHYCKQYKYSYHELKQFCDEYFSIIEQRKTRQYEIMVERSKMTNSVRYDILKRDDFRCQICGSTAQDGVKLHVDHIVPVSKGGQTIPSNLRTLCDRCNLGKSDKM